MIGERLKLLRKEKNLSQGDIEERTGLQRCYVSRVENGHTVPSVETLQKMAGALEVPLYKFFHEGDEPARALIVSTKSDTEEWGMAGKAGQYLRQMQALLAKMEAEDRRLLLQVAYKVARKKQARSN